MYVAEHRWRRHYFDATAIAITLLGLLISVGGVLAVLDARQLATLGLKLSGVIYMVLGSAIAVCGLGIIVRLNLARIVYLVVHTLGFLWTVFVLTQLIGAPVAVERSAFQIAVSQDQAAIAQAAQQGLLSGPQGAQVSRELHRNLRADERRLAAQPATQVLTIRLTSKGQLYTGIGLAISIAVIVFFMLPHVRERFY